MKVQIKVCENCGKQNDGSYGSGRFCCKQCARSFATKNNRSKTNEKASIGVKLFYKQKYDLNPKYCKICGKKLPWEKRKSQTCCKECHLKNMSKIQKSIPHVFKENGQGRGKSGWYKGFFCNSTYELALLIYCLDKKIPIIRNTKGYTYIWNNKVKTYYPDFRINGKLVEVKGIVTKQVIVKLKAVDEPIKLLTYNSLEKYMNYVDKKYGKKHSSTKNNYYTLYDNYKPKKVYICEQCGKHFESENIRKEGKHIFCSRRCSGLYMSKQIKHREIILPDGFVFIKDENEYAINKDGDILSFKYKKPKILKKYLYHSREYVFFNKKRKRVDLLLKENFDSEHT